MKFCFEIRFFDAEKTPVTLSSNLPHFTHAQNTALGLLGMDDVRSVCIYQADGGAILANYEHSDLVKK